MIPHDRFVRVLLSAGVVLLAANLLVGINSASSPRTAVAAGIPDSGAQFQAMVDNLSDANKKLDHLQTFLESGDLTVKVKDLKTDKDK